MSLRAVFAASGAWLVWTCCGCQLAPRAAAPTAALRDPSEADRLNQQALMLLDAERFAEAEPLLRAAVAADPYFGPAHCNLGVCLLRQERFYDAAWELRHAAQLMPRASAPRLNLGLLYEAVGRFGDAEAELAAALDRAPGDVVVAGQLARLHIRQAKHTPQTQAWLEQVVLEHADAAWRRWAQAELVDAQHSSPDGG